MSAAPPPFTQAELFAFWNALFAYPAGETDAMLAHFYRVALPLLGADDGYWLLMVRLTEGKPAERDLCKGWRARAIVPAVPTPQRLALIRSFLNGSDKLDPVHVGQTSINICATHGRFRVESLHGGLVDWEEFRQTEHHRLYYQARNVADRIWAVCPVNANVELCYNFDRFHRPEREDDRRHPGPEHLHDAQPRHGALQEVRRAEPRRVDGALALECVPAARFRPVRPGRGYLARSGARYTPASLRALPRHQPP